MKTYLRNFTFFSLIFLLASCGFNNNDTKNDPIQPEETKEITLNDNEKADIFNKIDTASNEVDIYDVVMKLALEESVGENKTVSRYELNGTIEESTLSLDLTTTDTTGGNTNKLHVYKSDGKVYVKNNDEAWMETIEQNGEFSNDATFYGNLTAALEKVIDEVELIEIGDVYEIRYTGSDTAVFNAFEKPFSLTLPGIDIEKEAEINVFAVVDKENLTINDLTFEIVAKKNQQKLKMSVDVDYKNINKATIQIPQEVIEESDINSTEHIEESTGSILSEEDKNSILDKIIESKNEVNIYEIQMDLEVEKIAGSNREASQAEFNGTIDENTFNVDLTTVEIQGKDRNENHVYKIDDVTYSKNNDMKWEKSDPSIEKFGEDSTTYQNLSTSIESIRDKVSIYELDDIYEIRYTGSEIEAFNAFEKPFNLWVTGADIEKDSEMKLLAIVDKKTNLINYIYFGVFIEIDGTQLSIVADTDFENINNTVIEIPQDVIDEAN